MNFSYILYFTRKLFESKLYFNSCFCCRILCKNRMVWTSQTQIKNTCSIYVKSANSWVTTAEATAIIVEVERWTDCVLMDLFSHLHSKSVSLNINHNIIAFKYCHLYALCLYTVVLQFIELLLVSHHFKLLIGINNDWFSKRIILTFAF